MEFAFPKRWPDGPLLVDVVNVDVLNEPVAREALRRAFEETVSERLDVLNKETGLKLQSAAVLKDGRATLSIVRIPFIGMTSDFVPSTICKMLDAHGAGNLCDPGQPLLKMDHTLAGEEVFAATTARHGVCVILENPAAGCMQTVVNEFLQKGGTREDLCLAWLQTNWSTGGEFSGSLEAAVIRHHFEACYPVEKPLLSYNSLISIWRTQVDACALLMLGFSNQSIDQSLAGTKWPGTGCSIETACGGKTSCVSRAPLSRAHMRALRYVYGNPAEAGVNVPSMKAFVEQ